MNKAFLSGRITAEPTVFGGDKKVTRLTLVTERPKLTNGKTTKKDGYTEMETEWHSITVFGGLGKTVAEHKAKSDKITVIGMIHYSSYEKEGVKKYSTEIIADEIEFH